MSETFATLIPPELSRHFGRDELHAVIFVPLDDRDGPLSEKTGGLVASVPEVPWPIIRSYVGAAGRVESRIVIICNTPSEAAEAVRMCVELLGSAYRRVSVDHALHAHFGLTN